MGYDLKSIKQDFKKKGIFYTDRELAKYMKSFFPKNVKEIYDPTCGDGGLLSVFDDNVKKYGQEINEEQLKVAYERLKNFHGEAGDTLKFPKFMDRKFQYIIANPPFSVKWEPKKDERFSEYPCLPPKSKADYAFIAHILYMLSDDGMAVVLNFPGILYRRNSEGKIRKFLVEKNYIEKIVQIDGGHFADTKIATALLVLRKNKRNTDIVFSYAEKEIAVTKQEIADNDYNLTISYYLPPVKQKKEEIDEEVLENQARMDFLKRLENELKFDKEICRLQGISINPFIKAIKRTASKFEEKEKKEIEGQIKMKL